jgi:hypothetical protein
MKELHMYRSTWIAAACVLCLALVNLASAQTATTTQSVNLAVNQLSKIAVSGNPAAMTITTGAAGVDNLTPVGDSSTTYSITHNNGTSSLRITASIDIAIAAGHTLTLKLASVKGTSAGFVDVSTATTAVNVVTNIAKGADAGNIITYRFNALASAGDLPTATKNVTLTITN